MTARELLSDVVRDLLITSKAIQIEPLTSDMMTWPALDWRRDAYLWRVTLSIPEEGGKTYRAITVDLHSRETRKVQQATARDSGFRPVEPKAADTLACLASDASDADNPFPVWAEDRDMSTDSISARRTHDACVAIREMLGIFLGEHFDRVLRAEH